MACFLNRAVECQPEETWQGTATHGSAMAGILLTPSRVMYSVFRSHVTLGTSVGVDVPEADAGKPLEANVPGAESSRNWSLGSRGGRLLGSGFRAKQSQ